MPLQLTAQGNAVHTSLEASIMDKLMSSRWKLLLIPSSPLYLL